MERTTKWMIAAVYRISLAVGIISFCHDQTTEKFYFSTMVTIYSAFASLVMLGFLRYFFQLNFSSPHLPVKINAIIFLLRGLCLVVTVFINWTKRQEIVTTLNELRQARYQFQKRWPLSENTKRKFEKTLRRKLKLGFATTTGILLTLIESAKIQFELESVYAIAAVILMCSVGSFVMMNFFLCITHLNVILWAVNEEVEKILKTTYQLWQLSMQQYIGPGTLITQCCRLSDDLDNLAATQHQLHLLGNRINRMYDLQTGCVLLMIYLNNVAVCYMAYPTAEKDQITDNYSNWTIVLMPFVMIMYYIDLIIFLKSLMHFHEAFLATKKLFREHQALLPTLDVRLEES
uniref:Gustatory receptor n=1 Tax=Stomoxys calcitrans TaxID=35570 RepID=A0A454A0P9_STOCA